ncbi:MAG: acyltransferase family protein [Candidatus Thorarchaeota archaeon]
MDDDNLVSEDINDLEIKQRNFFQIDLLKAFMIAFVIFDHAVAYSNRFGNGFELWERMAIPFFMIIMGFNAGNSFASQEKDTLKHLYTINYFKRKFWRFIFPYLVFYLISTIIGFVLFRENFPDTFKKDWILEYIVFQKTLFEFPGGWFIPILFQSIFLLPLLYKAFSKFPILSLIACFVIEFFMHLFLFYHIGPITSAADWQREIRFRYLILMYLSAIGMGMWFSQNYNLFSKRNIFVWVIFPFSLIYMIAWDFFDYRLAIDGSGIVRGDYNYITFIYSALIFLIILKIVPKNPKNIMARFFKAMGKATFHIFFVQGAFYAILFFNHLGVWNSSIFQGVVNIFGISSTEIIVNIGFMSLNWIICISLGLLWWLAEKHLKKLIKRS